MYDMLALYEAKDVQDAVRLRLEHPEAQIIAGGTDVLVQMREGKRAGKALISIQKCDEMRGVSIDAEENIRIGSLTSFTHITNDPIIQRYINVLGEAVDMVGGPQIRNAGTIGGNTCNGVTSADSASTLHAWEAIVEITGKNGVRRVPIRDFYIKAGTVDLRVEDGEIQTAILIPKTSYDRTWGHYIKYAMRNAMDIATLGTSVNARLSPDGGTFERVRIAFGVAGPVPMRAENAEAFINGRAVTLENIEEFGRKVLEDINPRDSWRASKAFRSHIGHYIKYAMRNAMDIATLGTSVNARLSPDGGTFERVRIAFGVAGPVPMRAENAEAFINGRAVTLENIEEFGRKVLEDINPRDSWRASKAFRSHIAVESAKRCLIESVKLAGGVL